MDTGIADILRRDVLKRATSGDTEALVDLAEYYPELGEILHDYADLIEKYDAITGKTDD